MLLRTAKVRFLKPFPAVHVAAGDVLSVDLDYSVFDAPTVKEVNASANVMLGLRLGLEPEFRFADGDFEILNTREVIEKLGYCPDGHFVQMDIPDRLPDSISADYGRPKPPSASQRQ